MEDALRVLDARALQYGREYPACRRVAKHDGKLYTDLCDEKRRAVEINRSGWRIVKDPPVKFTRTRAMRSLPEPEPGGCIERLGDFVNFASEDDFYLAVGWLVMAFNPCGPFPVLDLVGEQGSGKSVAARGIRSLVDPSEAPLRSMPKDERDLIISAINSYVLAFDNLSTMPGWFSDGLCRMSTGSGYTTRRLHTDSEEMTFSASRAVIVNGIPNLTDRPDLADRAIAIHLPTISEHDRRPESVFWREFEAATPGILGALLDGVSSALRNLPDTKLERLPRMADFALFVSAAESGLGWPPGSFMAAYDKNRQSIFEAAAEADPLVLLIRAKFDQLRERREAQEPRTWEGRPTDIFNDLNAVADEGMRKSRAWPTTPASLGAKIRRAAPTLRRCGFIVEYSHSGSRLIRIVRGEIVR